MSNPSTKELLNSATTPAEAKAAVTRARTFNWTDSAIQTHGSAAVRALFLGQSPAATKAAAPAPTPKAPKSPKALPPIQRPLTLPYPTPMEYMMVLIRDRTAAVVTRTVQVLGERIGAKDGHYVRLQTSLDGVLHVWEMSRRQYDNVLKGGQAHTWISESGWTVQLTATQTSDLLWEAGVSPAVVAEQADVDLRAAVAQAQATLDEVKAALAGK